MKTKFIPGAHKIIQADEQDVGTILIQEEPDHFKLVHLELLPLFQNKGIGTKLIKEILDKAKTKNKYVWLKVLKTNPAIELYKKLGFVKIGEEELKYIMRFN
jgi:ribosomal protein S18 acetylase RimI-like enzyme